ncbi:uncharacterized protein K452DRAFT_292485 [Aplosporella prunicola CBS 121167]|uniref:Uncharacterized protein n=1 Tax=Aplosporella prunicola CBS 121167 TaxID=1176127 RepID=A0A6A6B0M5_9PEZI|nr:uncharacterized protein K452DRAFT_292551 [Aplosporella prunicola CBS 121167]XP_033392065.1 uncharacterized protein K452DRAFT_292485 [Aplosporella prunicola CBS 121167]KAF2136271.1 hypothetical protein K452DRAFT_292551 [Aplosporella prunicola CBS 121167]KAF2136347.1 hypothetical protein K452DRAFT_292485 [Aplosporella prunicola CBS 121167]
MYLPTYPTYLSTNRGIFKPAAITPHLPPHHLISSPTAAARLLPRSSLPFLSSIRHNAHAVAVASPAQHSSSRRRRS